MLLKHTLFNVQVILYVSVKEARHSKLPIWLTMSKSLVEPIQFVRAYGFLCVCMCFFLLQKGASIEEKMVFY